MPDFFKGLFFLSEYFFEDVEDWKTYGKEIEL